VYVADNWDGAMDCVDQQDLHLVLCNFPFELIESDLGALADMRALNEDLPIIVATGFTDQPVVELMENGASLVVSQTVEAVALASLIDEIARADLADAEARAGGRVSSITLERAGEVWRVPAPMGVRDYETPVGN